MSESLHKSPEKLEAIDTTEQLEKQKVEALAHSKETKHEHAEALEKIRQKIEQEAISKEKPAVEKEKPTSQHITKQLKALRYKETIRYVRRHLSKNERKLSTFIHTPSIEAVSEVGAKTVARPSGILGGGVVALSGSVITLIIANTIGFTVPNSLFLVLFVVGFACGVVVELGWSLIVRRKRGRYYRA